MNQIPPEFPAGFCVYYLWVMEMKQNWKTYLFWIALAEGVGALAGWLTRDSMDFYKEFVEQPALAPPAIVFPIVWGILYALMGFGAARVSLAPEGPARSLGLNLFVAQLIVNFFWSLIFFNLRTYGFALLWLGVLIVWMILAFRKSDPLAAWLQVPYLLWVTFAAYLNWGVWVLN